jgi:hypothetical protein
MKLIIQVAVLFLGPCIGLAFSEGQGSSRVGPVEICRDKCSDRCQATVGDRKKIRSKCEKACAFACNPKGKTLFKCSIHHWSSISEAVEEMYGEKLPARNGYLLDSGREVLPVVAARKANVLKKLAAMKKDPDALAKEAALMRMRGSILRADSDVVGVYSAYAARLKKWELALGIEEKLSKRAITRFGALKCSSKDKAAYLEIDGARAEDLLSAYETCGFPDAGLGKLIKRVRYVKEDCPRREQIDLSGF